MVNLHSLPKIIKRKKKRLGRGLGSGKGAKSGRGTKRHQKAREDIPIHFEGGQGKITKKYPLLRGKGKNKSRRPQPIIISLEKLNKFETGETVTIKSLVDKGLVDKKAHKIGVKVLANGELKKKLYVKVPLSKKAKEIVDSLSVK